MVFERSHLSLGSKKEKAMSTFVLLGGKDAQNSKNFSLEIKIWQHLGLIKPRILWVGFANFDKHVTKYEEFKSILNEYPCEIHELLDLTHLEEQVSWADVIYFCGGHAKKLYEMVQDGYLSHMILNLSNKIWMGISAGAMLFCKAGMGDATAYLDGGHMWHYEMVRGLGCLNFTICPHYNHDGLWCYNDEVRKYACDGIALEDDTAVVINQKIEVFKTNRRRSVYLFDSNKDYQMIPLYEE